MATRKQRPSTDRARLKVLAAGDERAFLAFVLELLASPQRLDREAALEALVERPVEGARDAVRALYVDLHADAPKSDRGGDQRGAILRYLLKQPHPHDAEVAVLASGTYENDNSAQDNTYNLRLLGLRLIGHVLPPAIVGYYAAEHLDDLSPHGGDEPAATAIGLLADTGNHVALYAWLRGAAERESPNLLRAFATLTDAPPEIVRRYIEQEIGAAMARSDESACMVFADAIVKLEIEQTYPAIAAIMDARVSDELFSYMAVLLASTNRPALLAILEGQLQPGGRTNLIVDALSIRTTPEQQAIMKRWEER